MEEETVHRFFACVVAEQMLSYLRCSGGITKIFFRP
jgi:hypothetical protein